MHNHAQPANTQVSKGKGDTLSCHDQDASVYTSPSSKMGCALLVELPIDPQVYLDQRSQ